MIRTRESYNPVGNNMEKSMISCVIQINNTDGRMNELINDSPENLADEIYLIYETENQDIDKESLISPFANGVITFLLLWALEKSVRFVSEVLYNKLKDYNGELIIDGENIEMTQDAIEKALLGIRSQY